MKYFALSPVASRPATCRDQPVSALPGLGLQAQATTQKVPFARLAYVGSGGFNSGLPACTVATLRRESPHSTKLFYTEKL